MSLNAYTLSAIDEVIAIDFPMADYNYIRAILIQKMQDYYDNLSMEKLTTGLCCNLFKTYRFDPHVTSLTYILRQSLYLAFGCSDYPFNGGSRESYVNDTPSKNPYRKKWVESNKSVCKVK